MADEMKHVDDDDDILGSLLEEDSDNTLEKKTDETDNQVAELQRQLELEHQRNSSLQGRVESQIRPLSDSVRTLQEKLAVQQKKPEKKTEVPPTVSVQDLLNDLSSEDREAIGEKQLSILANLIEKPTESKLAQAQAEFQNSQSELQAVYDKRIAQLESQIAGQTGSQLWEKVDQVSPGARSVNEANGPRWIAFLDGADSSSGRRRRDLGNAAVQVGDVVRLAALHNEFLETIGEQPAEDAKRDRSSQARPEGTRAEPAVGEGAAKPSIKEADIAKFYSDLAQGKYVGKEKLADKMESAITTAIQEGRINV